MKDKTKARISVLQYLVESAKQAAKTKNIHERLAAVELEAEFVERIERLKAEDREPDLPLGNGTEG